MTNLSQRNAKRFDGLRDDCLAAIKRTNDERRNAIRNGDAVSAGRLTERRSALRQSLQDIEDAEDAWLRSTLTVAEAENRLAAARDRSINTVKAMKDIASAIQKAGELIGLLTGLVTLFG
jgi:hypothetical protein